MEEYKGVVDFLRDAARGYGRNLADGFGHKPTEAEIEALDERAQREFGDAYLGEVANVFDQEIARRFRPRA